MQAFRQASSGLIYALLSIVLVLGSLSIALAERNASAPPPATATRAVSPSASKSSTPTTPSTAGETSQVAASAATAAPASLTPSVRYPTLAPTGRVTTATHAATIPCGPPAAWVRTYVVQPGDSMFHIATLFHTTVSTLQRANCRTDYLIFTGERLWVPNVQPAPTGVTIIPPFFDTPTDEPAYAVTQTPLYFTPTEAPTDTETPGP